MANFDAVLFDFDGTVADTGEGVFFCVRHAIDVHGLEQPSDEEIRKFIGPPMTVSFHTLYPWLTDDDVESLMVSYREKYAETGLYKYYLYDGMTELLQKLKANGVKTAVASSKPQEALTEIIKVSGIDKYFDCIVGADKRYKDSDKAMIVNSAIEKTGVTDRSRILMVGDRKFDIVGAHKAGIVCAAVLFGYGSREEFVEYKADYIVESCEEIADIVFGR
ncbi:MAG: HAD family hydrolase [Acutalibacteraceae bacterium]